MAVLLVVLYPRRRPGLDGGYVGVDVFFVISGFVITGLLLRERASTGRTSILDFYARRVRRILPAATLVILVTVVASLPGPRGRQRDQTAVDGRWAAVFLSNFHFGPLGTNYFTRVPAPVPAAELLVPVGRGAVLHRLPDAVPAGGRDPVRGVVLPARLAVASCVVIVASFSLSVVQTASHPAAAYFSPFTRAWELALGGAGRRLRRRLLPKAPPAGPRVLTWVGAGRHLGGGVRLHAATAYPG